MVPSGSPAKFYQLVPKTPLNPGDTTAQIIVKVVGDILVEPDETFYVNLSNPANATINVGRAQGTILNDDAMPVIDISDAAVKEGGLVEGNSGTTPAVFTVKLSAPSAEPVTVKYATADGTANAGSDYIATTGTLTFAPGQTEQTITVLILGDTLDEADETFYVNLSGASNSSIGRAQGIGTILNDDAPPVLNINDVQVLEGNSGTTPAVFTVTLSAPSGLEVAVNFATADGTALAGQDYQATQGTLHFAAEVDTPASLGPASVNPVPRPSIAVVPGGVRVTWPATVPDWQLQACDTLGDRKPWLAVGATPVLSGTQVPGATAHQRQE